MVACEMKSEDVVDNIAQKNSGGTVTEYIHVHLVVALVSMGEDWEGDEGGHPRAWQRKSKAVSPAAQSQGLVLYLAAQPKL